MYGKYSVYIYLSYGLALFTFAGLAWRAFLDLKQAKQVCRAMLNEHLNERNS